MLDYVSCPKKKKIKVHENEFTHETCILKKQKYGLKISRKK